MFNVDKENFINVSNELFKKEASAVTAVKTARRAFKRALSKKKFYVMRNFPYVHC